MNENQTAPIDHDDIHVDMPELVDVTDYLHSTLNAVMPDRRPATLKPIVVTFECKKTSKADELKCVICLETRHTQTTEAVHLASCCKCPIHLSCVYKWLAAQYDNYIPHAQWGCPHCRAPVKDLANNPDPCVLCKSKEVNQLYHEPVSQAVPCCNASVHQQCLYQYITETFHEKRFPCPACKTLLAAERTMTMAIRNPNGAPSYSAVTTERIEARASTHPMITRSRGRGRGYQLHRGRPQRPLRYPDTNLSCS